ncbi:carbamoyl-phosphate synthase large subunit [Ruaniaceae bacterium KH17]|nr:carbamoyl-phosphate synthase large subunit [Ruaniaceae bacterium KH17]
MTDHRPCLLVIGASSLQVPAIVTAQRLGYRVAAVDRNPSAPGARIADEFAQVSTTDAIGIKEVAAGCGAQGIITIGTDLPMRALAFASQALGLRSPSEESAYVATDKIAMHEALDGAGVPIPKSVPIVEKRDLAAASGVGFPLILKPADSSGSRGVTRVDSADELEPAYVYACRHSPTGHVIAQQFLRGAEFSVEGFCIGATPRIVAITDKVTTGPPHFVEVGHSQPSALSPDDRRCVNDTVMRAARALRLSDCAIHAEIMMTADGPRIIEVGARLGGDFITSHLVPLSTGVDMIRSLIEIVIGREPQLDHQFTRGSAVRFLDQPADSDRVAEITKLEGVIDVSVQNHDLPGGIQSSIDRFGYVITTGETSDSAARLANDVGQLLMASARRIL